jgi:hypothetical protein
MTLVAFGMPFVALAFMSALAYGIARYNRRPSRLQPVGYVIEKVSWRSITETRPPPQTTLR